ncbi:unnamed protein product [Heligmosomoides polygyrus]|uniref:Secreted protein n=1 Tax=Heligmosomoides polygyrus TaxID=6339 RepID=A0A183FFG8_HELPZ|nr:unnamed protein product [Heligmosomoides polygyrus]
MEGLLPRLLAACCWLWRHLRALFSCVKSTPQPECEERHKLLLTSVPLIDFVLSLLQFFALFNTIHGLLSFNCFIKAYNSITTVSDVQEHRCFKAAMQ